MLTLRSISIAYGNKTLFSGLDLTIDRGQLVGIAGESGCGKTSLLRALLGFVPLAAGSIKVANLPLDASHINEIRRLTAYVPQELQPPAEDGAALVALTHTLAFNRTLLAATVPEAPASASLEQVLSSLAIDPSLLSLSASKLSGGQRQRILLAAAIALPKPLLLLDEPTSALDEDSTQRVVHTLQHVCHDEHRIALVVSHDPILLAACDKVIDLTKFS